MKTVLQIVSRLWYILLCTLVVSCSDSPELPDDSPITPPSTSESTPEPVLQNYRLKDGVNEIKGSNLNYIVEAIDGITLVLSDSYPSDELPVVGEIVFVYPNAEKLPYGFLGKVSEVNQSDGNYHLETESVDLDEAFSYLSVDETVDLELYAEGEEIADSRVSFEKINGYYCASLDIIGKYNFKEALTIDVEGQLTCGVRRNASILINDSTDTNISVVSFDYYVSLGGKMHFNTEIKNGDDGYVWINKGQLENIFNNPVLKARIPAGLISFFASPTVDVNLATKLEAAFSFGVGFNFSNESSLSVISENRASRLVHKRLAGEEPAFTLLPNLEFSVSGSAFTGVNIEPAIQLFGRDDMEVKLQMAVGPRLSGELSYDPTTDKGVYEALKDDKISASIALVAEAGGEFAKKCEWSIPLLDLDLWTIAERYVFPDFTNFKIGVEDNNFKLASAMFKRDIIFKTPVGIAAYDESDSIIFKTEPETYWNEKDFEKINPIVLKYENTNENNKYSLWTYVKWGDNYIKCKQFERKIKSISYSMDDRSEYYTFTYDSEGLISEITIKYAENGNVFDTEFYNFKYSDDKKSVQVSVSDRDGHAFSFNISLNESGYVESCRQTYNGGGADSWSFEYNEMGQMTCMKRSEGNETWKIVYSDFNATSISFNGANVSRVSYGTLENLSNMVMHESMYGVDADEMEVLGAIGMLGRPSKNFPSVVNSPEGWDYDSYYSWGVDDDGYPKSCCVTESGDVHYWSFTWE